MKELQDLIKYLKENGYSHIKVNPDLLIGIIEYFASKQETKQCNIADVSNRRELLIDFMNKTQGNLIWGWNLGGGEKLADEYLKGNL